MPRPHQQELIEKVRRHLLSISELVRRIAEAIAYRNGNTTAELDMQVDRKDVELGIYRHLPHHRAREAHVSDRNDRCVQPGESVETGRLMPARPRPSANQHDQRDAPGAVQPTLRILTLWENCYDRHDTT
jgi:hypothetical protein